MKQKKPEDLKEEVLGYAVLPLVKAGTNKIIDNDAYELSVFIPGYGKKGTDAPTLAVATKLNSSIYSQDSTLNDLFAACGKNELDKKVTNIA